jgi:hypothetical protein
MEGYALLGLRWGRTEPEDGRWDGPTSLGCFGSLAAGRTGAWREYDRSA